jgi:hypothetical protein
LEDHQEEGGAVNRTDATREIVQTIEWMMATVFEGRCPRCEALGLGDDSVMLQTDGPEGRQRWHDGAWIGHTDSCPCETDRFFDRAGFLCQRFGLEVEFASELRDGKLYFGPRFVRESGLKRNPKHLHLIGADRYTFLSHDGSWHETTGEDLR